MRQNRNITWRKTIPLAGISLVLGLYIAMPIIAGVAAIGDRRGPRIYPEAMHAALYLIGWEMGNHEAMKPRLPIDPPARPWFYGL